MTTFADLITPADPAWLEHGRQLWRDREDLQQACPDPDHVGFRKWMASYGALEYPTTLGAPFPPLPAEELRIYGSGGGDAGEHLRTGLDDLEMLHRITDLCGPAPLSELGSVLDFGTGSGRVARWIEAAAPTAEVSGCDVRHSGIDWCREHLRGRYEATSTEPPLPFEDDSFDLVFALSLFSHFTEASADAWLRELCRVCRPDGRLILTTHGTFATWVIADSEQHQKFFGLSAAEARELAVDMQSKPFAFLPIQRSKVNAPGEGPSEDYGHAFLTHRHVETAWAQHADPVGYLPAVHMLFQDAWILRPRAPG